MSNNFDPSKLGNTKGSTQSSKPRSERVFMTVESYQTPTDGFHYAVGRRADKPDEQIRVRLNTVNERAADRPNENVEKIKALYVTGENTRDSIAEKAKANVPFLSFDDARKISTVDGVTEYRAHWPKTMSTAPQAEVVAGMAHIRLRDASEYEGKRTAAQAYVEMFKGSSVASADNIDTVLADALAIKDEQGRARDPLVILRVMHDGKQVAAPRIYPETTKTKIFDQGLGDFKEVPVKLDAAATIAKVMEGGPGRNDFETRQLDTARALIAGIKGLDEPTFATTDDAIRGNIRNLFYGAQQGALQVEIVSAEKIDFGADSRKTYLADKNRPQLAAYEVREENGDNVKQTPGYTNTVVAMLRHPDGEPYAVFATPSAMYPKVSKLVDLPLQAAPAKELANETVNDNAQPEPEAGIDHAPADEPVAEPEVTADDNRYDDGPGM